MRKREALADMLSLKKKTNNKSINLYNPRDSFEHCLRISREKYNKTKFSNVKKNISRICRFSRRVYYKLKIYKNNKTIKTLHFQ